jgi:site-specific DNA-methyltransferase (adenine-specific)
VTEPVTIGPATLYLGDCRQILPTLEGIDAVVTDPPYGIDAGNMRLGFSRSSRLPASDWDSEAPDLTPVLALNVPSVIWGGNYFPLPPTRCVLVWDKGGRFRARSFSECEVAWCSEDGVARIFFHDPIHTCLERTHKTQKPVKVMEWSLSFVEGTTVCDPFMGSGTTGVACLRLGRKFVGIEIDPGHFATACRRIRDAWDADRSSLFPAFGGGAA